MIEDADWGTWLQEPHQVVARKPHGCHDCGRTIAAGETYHYGTWAGSEGLSVCKMCAHCVAAGLWLIAVCGGHLWPGVTEDLAMHWTEEPDYRSVGLGRLLVASRNRWRRNGELIPLDDVTRWARSGAARVPALAHD